MLLTIDRYVLAVSSFMPHGMCYLWKPSLVGLHIISNAAISLAYFSIPITLVYILRNRADIPFNFLFFLFAAFIILCGSGHAFDIWTLWHPNYWISAYIRAITALVSVATAIALARQIPQIIALPSLKQMKKANRKIQQEIEERKQIERELVKERQFLQALLENISDGIVACNQDGVLTLFNRATQEFHGLPLNSIPAQDWAKYYNLYHSDGTTPMQKNEIPLFRSFQGESVREVEMMIIPKQGQARTILANSDPIIAPNHERLGAVVVMHDITERKQGEQQLKESEARLRQAKQTAEAANKAKDSFIAHISHELRTPLNSILGFTQILQKNANSKGQSQQLDCIYQSSLHLLTLINGLLDLSKITAEKLTLELEDFCFSSFLDNLTSFVTLQTQQENLSFHYQLLSSVPQVVYADKTRLQQILLNLLNNAVKFTKTGGISFKVGYVEDFPKNSNLSINSNQKRIRFQVEDTGSGIPTDRIEIIFLPFEQLKNNNSSIKGTGLGLAISSNLVQLMDSQIHVESTLGKGSTFWFDVDLPAIDAPIVYTPVKHKSQPIGFRGRSRRILIVDDNIKNRQVLIHLLQPLGFELVEAENGQEGLAQAQAVQPDAILLDIVMPVMDGAEMATRIRQDPKLQKVTIIAISANTRFSEEINFSRELFDAFVVKPVDLNQILNLLETHLQLEWTTIETVNNTKTKANNFGKDLVTPPEEKLKEILQLANLGDIKKILEEASSLEKLDSKYLVFTQKLAQLAKSFEQEKLLAFLEKCLEGRLEIN